MKIRASLILVMFTLFCASFDDVQKARAEATGDTNGVERAGTSGTQNTPGLISAQETHSTTAPFHFEPLLLLLLGSTMFSIGSAIKLILSRRLTPKPIRAATSRSSSGQL